MKTKLLFTLLLSFYFYLLSSQIPQGINYQAIARDEFNNPIKTPFQVKIGFQSDTLLSTYIWEELHGTVKPNSTGLFSLVIGTGTRLSGVPAFSDIDWTASPFYLKTYIYFNNSWKYMGAAQLWSVPYSIVAGGLGGAIRKLEVMGENETSDEALFEVKRKDGQTMFAVYNHGVRVFMPLDTVSKARKGGFAIGGFDKAKGTIQDYFVVNPDSIRAYIDTNPAKARKGGFAIGGFDKSKAPVEEYLLVTSDSTRIYVNDTTAKGKKGGFAIGGFDRAKGGVVPFVDLTPKNYFIGHESGSNTTGKYNSFLGYQSGKDNTTGEQNIFFGYQAGRSNINGDYNIFIGYQSGYNTLGPSGAVGGQEGSFNCYLGYHSGFSSVYGSHNTAVGYGAGSENSADKNTFIGSLAGALNTTGRGNTFLGTEAGHFNTVGNDNSFLGRDAGKNTSAGSTNTMVGSGAGANISSGNGNVIIGQGAMGKNYFATSGSGSSNIIIGCQAGYSVTDGSSNIFIGNQAGFTETGSNLLIVENSNSVTPLIYGNFISNDFRINGNIEYTGTIGTVSDIRLKKNITGIENVMEKLILIKGIYYEWDQNDTIGLFLEEGRQLGVIAQDVEEVYPELVKTSDNGYKIVDYAKLTPVLLEAIKEQQLQIESYKSQLQSLQEKVDQIDALLTRVGMK